MLKTASLPDFILHVVSDKGTERPFSGEYDKVDEAGTYLCRQCGLALFRSTHKFQSSCGWPSFDEEIKSAVSYEPDADGNRTEILCTRCHAHLGHVFTGEHFTSKNTRYCVNSLSLDFVPNVTVEDTEEAMFAAGCFWGVEYFFKKLKGVLKTQVGYSGGRVVSPSYQTVCDGQSGHYEVIRVVYDPKIVSYEQVAKYFFEIHDITQTDGQGPDIGQQYKSVLFYYNDEQKKIAEDLVNQLKQRGFDVATTLLPVKPFWPAETYHQDYYEKTAKAPYCHHYVKRF